MIPTGYESEGGAVIPTGYESERVTGIDHDARHGDRYERNETKHDRPVELIVGATAGGGRRSPPSRSWHSIAASGRDFIFGRNSSTLLLPRPYGYCASLKSGYNVYPLT